MKATTVASLVLGLALALVPGAGCKKQKKKGPPQPKPGPAIVGVEKSVVGKWRWAATKVGDEDEPRPMKLESFETFAKDGSYKLVTPGQGDGETGTWKQAGDKLVIELARTKRAYKFTVLDVTKDELVLYRRSKNAKLYYERVGAKKAGSGSGTSSGTGTGTGTGTRTASGTGTGTGSGSSAGSGSGSVPAGSGSVPAGTSTGR